MKKFANIVSGKELSNHIKLDWIDYFIVNPDEFRQSLPVDKIKDTEFVDAFQKRINPNMYYPTLIIGWSMYQKAFPEFKPDILDKTYKFNVCWEFSMEEKITDHFTGIENFIKNAPKQYIESYKFVNIDPILYSIQSEENLIDVIGKYLYLPHVSLYQYLDNMIYLLDRGSKTQIVGLHLNAYKYFGFDIEKIKGLLYAVITKNSRKCTIDQDGAIYQSYYRKFPDFDQLKRSMVLFLD